MRYNFTEKLRLGVLCNMVPKKIVYPNLIRWCLDNILEMNKYFHTKLKSDTYREEKRMGESLFRSVHCTGCTSTWFASWTETTSIN